MFEILTKTEIKNRIEEKSHTILPKTWWSGEKKDAGVLEVYEPGSRKKGGYEPIFDTGQRKKVEVEIV